MQTDKERTLYNRTVLSFVIADKTNLSATEVAHCVFLAPFTGHIKEFVGGYVDEAGGGTTPSLLFTLESGDTILTSALATTALTPVSSGEVTIFVTKGDVLNIKLDPNNADNDFQGITATVTFAPPLSTT